MIAYFDSSSIVKWFFDEPGMDLSRHSKELATAVFTSVLSLPEVMSAFNRALFDERCTKSDLEIIKTEFERIWHNFQRIRTNEALITHAGLLVFSHNLRGYDAVHLASALLLKKEIHEEDLFFSCFDKNLNRAAQKEGLIIH